VRSTLKRIDGVKNVETDTRKRIAKIIFDDSKTGLQDFLKALKEDRFDATVIDKSEAEKIKNGKSCGH